MIAITELATEKIAAYLNEQNIESPVRIAAMSGCGGPSLGLAIDECKESDHVHKNASVTLLIDQGLSDICGKVTVDYQEASSGSGCSGGGGFSVASEKPLPASSGGCGSSCSSGGCGC